MIRKGLRPFPLDTTFRFLYTTKVEYRIRQLSWFKRRIPTKEPVPTHVEISDIELVENSYCNMVVTYDDGNVYEFEGRVNHNEIKDTWTVHGFDSKGHQCFVDIIDE